MVFVDPRNPKPLHEQIKESIIEQITLGVLSPGDRLPSVREMSQSLRIAPNTIQRAYSELDADGVISSYPGRGSFIMSPGDAIRERRIAGLAARLVPIVAELRRLGVTEDEIIGMVSKGGGHGG